MRNAGLDEAQAGIKITGRNISNLRYADDTTLKAEKKKTKTDQQKKNKWKFTHTCIAQTQEHSAVSNSEEWLELGLI